MPRILLLTVLAAAGLSLMSQIHAEVDQPSLRRQARQLYEDGNYREALAKFRDLTLQETVDQPQELAHDVQLALTCYQQLNEASEIDAYLEEFVETHGDQWRMLAVAGQSYQSIPHYGYLIAGEFRRGQHRGGGNAVNVQLRDRVQALQLFRRALTLLQARPEGRQSDAARQLLEQFAQAVLQGYGNAWRMQLLTDLDELPDYDDPSYYGGSQGAPVDEQGGPVFYDLPESWEAAENDGERWRWLLSLRTQWQPKLKFEEWLNRAEFLHSQFGVQTMARYQWFGRQSTDGGDESGIYAVHTLGEGETIAQLATGVKRFDLPKEHNHILLLRRVVDEAEVGSNEWWRAASSLAHWLQDRRQYPQAAELFQRLVDSGRKQFADQLEQIIGAWGRLEPTVTQPAGRGATIEFRFRNGKEVEFTAHEIDLAKLLADVKAFYSRQPKQGDKPPRLEQLGYHLVHENRDEYVKGRVARWTLELEPRENHFDRRITVSTPLQKAGAYLLTAKMKDGNQQSVVIWLNDAAIVKKRLDGKTLYYVADAVTGKPSPGCNVEFFGFWNDAKITDAGKQVIRRTKNFAEKTDRNGLIALAMDEKQLRRAQWLQIARPKDGGLAFLGFNRVWHGGQYNRDRYQQVKCFTITDRPVYRPGHNVQFKAWIRRAAYDLGQTSQFANQTFRVEIHNPRNERVYSESLTADAYGGIAGALELPDDATLGQYRVTVVNHGGGSFRVEEYKKPEYEVTIEAPDEPVMLGEKITAKIKADYYFGAPVVNATVKYKVLRTPHDQRWYPPMPWDWLYGPGYWWFTPDYDWYPGFARWGCVGPRPSWFWRPSPQPELVAEREVAIGPDGTVEVEIDTALAKEFHSDTDHRYQIQAEVVDQSRRTVVANGEVLVAREPFNVTLWTHRGFYRAGETIEVRVAARTLAGKPVAGEGKLQLLSIDYENGKPQEREVASWDLDTSKQGRADLKITAAKPGQYRLAYTLTDADDNSVEGAQVLTVRGENFASESFRFNDVEIVPDRREYAPGDKVRLQVSADQADATVLLFLRPAGGVYLPPQVVKLDGKSSVVEFEVEQADMPNFFVEAVTVHGARLHTAVRELFVPPADRTLNVDVVPSSDAYLPGQDATVKLKLTDGQGNPVVGSTVVAIYDKALEYISGGGNVPNIKEFFWKWRRSHRPSSETNLGRVEYPTAKPNTPQMHNLGVFGETVADAEFGFMKLKESSLGESVNGRATRAMSRAGVENAARPMAATAADFDSNIDLVKSSVAPIGSELVEPTVRKEFADTALWVAALETNSDGLAEVTLKMPENLTTWKANVWAMAPGTRVGEAAAEVVTRKNIIVRLQAPRFFVETDEVVLSANVHNYLDEAKQVRVRLELDGGALKGPEQMETTVEIAPGGEHRVDWRVKAIREGDATVRMIAQTDEESDAMQMSFPVLVHGMLKTESYSGAIRLDQDSGKFTFTIPAERRADETRVEIRYSPTLAGAMLEALPYLADYPYGCTEQTLNRFLPSVITQRTLQRMGVDLAAIKEKQANLNAQEIGDPGERSKRWKRFKIDPVFDEAELVKRVKSGVDRLTEMQLSDGGWGWFSGFNERSTPHMTAVVVRGLLIAKQNDVAIVPGVIDRGVAWLEGYQQQQVEKLNNWDREGNKKRNEARPAKPQADNMDALVYMVLAEAERENRAMGEYLYTDRTKLSVYAHAACGLAFHKQGHAERVAMVLRNLTQYLQQDDENQTAWLNLPGNIWWYWYGSEYEAHAYYLKLLVAVEPNSKVAPRLVKYLLNNRRHATYWNSTRDTALVVEAFADFLKATGEAKPDLELEIWIDGEKRKTVKVSPENLFTFDDRLILSGEEVETGKHTVELRRRGGSPVYWNAYVTNFTLEDPITAAGLELKVQRNYYKLTRKEKATNVAGSSGRPVEQNVEAYDRTEIVNFEEVTSGDLVEVELIVESKNDYEYIVLEDKKPAGCEAVEVRSGYTGNALGAYVEFRDEQVALFVQRLARGKHSVSYRLRAEIPGKFSALPTKMSAMYAPELKANSDEFKLRIAE